ncbi:MAG: ORF6N domain-containing protein [Verrucomicrobia bacterium]|nr:ORF6N domain-containing protein [Verrucomicrobiota bacterium]
MNLGPTPDSARDEIAFGTATGYREVVVSEKSEKYYAPAVEERIFTVRGQKVILDSDLARIYGVQTFRFNEAVKRNQHRFPPDFRFQLTVEEWAAVRSLRSQNTILDEGPGLHSSQIAMSSDRHRGAAYRPWGFTEHGAMMAANVLNSDRAVEMSV